LNAKAYDFVHLALHAMGGEIQGRTKLQKTVYFLGVMTDHLEELGYGAHYYGPYSAQVAQAADRLVSLGFVDLSVSGTGGIDSRGFEVARYDYKLNDEGKRVAELKKERFPGEWQKIQEAAQRLGRAGEQDYMSLSIAAKIHFMLGEKQGKATLGELSEYAQKFGWAVSADEAREAAQFLQKIDLVQLVGDS